MTPRERVLDLINQHGWNATAFQTLEAGYSYAFYGDDACVAYVDTGSAWVAAGAPIAPSDRIVEVALAFAASAREAGKRCCFFATEERLLSAAGPILSSLRIGEQPVWDPQAWPEILAEHPSLREQLRRARAKGVRTRAVETREFGQTATHAAVTRVVERWLATRNLAPLDFLVRVEPLSYPEHRRCFVAELDGRLVGFAGVVPVPARDGWFLEDLVRDPDAPNGTSELLVDAVMRWARAAGSTWLTLGLSPLAGEVAAPLRLARLGSSFLYDFDGLRRYKAKLRPRSWSPVYLTHPAAQSALASLIDALSAFTNGGFLRFGLRSLLRGPLALLRLLTALLPAWILLLILAPTAHWFGSLATQWAWITFDCCLALGLLHLLRRPSIPVFTLLAVAVTTDAIVTLLQALFFNLGHARGPLDYLIILIACSAPALAALILWAARRTRLRTA